MNMQTTSLRVSALLLLTGMVFPADAPAGTPITETPALNISSTPGNSSVRRERAPSQPRFSPWTTEMVTLAQAGIDESILYAYMDCCAGTFNLGADQIITLTQLGLSGDIITAMLQHDADILAGVRPVPISAAPASTIEISVIGSGETTAEPHVPLAPAVAPASESAVSAAAGSAPPAPVRSIVAPEKRTAEETLTVIRPGEFHSWRESSSERASLYPVREPHPVPLTAPIVVMRAAGRTPNTIIIRVQP